MTGLSDESQNVKAEANASAFLFIIQETELDMLFTVVRSYQRKR